MFVLLQARKPIDTLHVAPDFTNKCSLDKPVVNAPVEAEVEGAEVTAFPHHLHHSLIVELRDVPQVQDTQVAQLREGKGTQAIE